MAKLFAWLGGAAFVASLAVCAWFYFVLLGRDAPFAGVAPVAVDLALVTIFAGHHSVFARDPIKRRLSFVPLPLRRSVYVWVASTLLVAVCLLWRPIGGAAYRATGSRALVHAAIQMGGLVLIVLAASAIDPLELAGIRQATASAIDPLGPPAASGSIDSLGPVRPVRDDRLQVGGPYRIVRHPLYLGWMLTVLGAAHMTGDRLAFAVMTSLYLVIGVRFEERVLLKSFGEDYARYRRQVRWRIVPFIY